ncbi:MAG: hypothetical protein J6O55_02335, partial [Lachnospiraceae bacterium]|nr:hypothetical protein [Lachnospiraceae bacterium]
RITPDGEIEFHGRRDSQVKLRGLRIELGEIEESMSGFDGIDSCAAAAIDSRVLCLYYVPSRPVSKGDLASYASSILPRYMVPDLFIELKEMPLTANMKIDRKALPKPDIQAVEHETPATDMQKRLLEMISSLMPGRDIGIETDLNAAGTTSLEYMAILAAIGDEYAVSVNFSDVVNAASIKELEGIIKSRPQLKPKEKLDRYPASLFQYTYYEEWTCLNNTGQMIPILLEIPKMIDLNRFKTAVKNAFLNHPGIFARLEFDRENEELWQLPPAEGAEKIFTFGEDLIFKEEDLEAFQYMLSMQLISPESYPYFMLHIARSEKRRFLYMNFAHVISDGDSVELLMEDIARSYDGLPLAKEGLTAYELALEQSETAASPLYDEREADYKEVFKDLEEWPDLSEGGTGADAAYDYVREGLCLVPEEIKELTEAYSVTESTLFAALTALFIYKYSQKKGSAFMMAYNGRSDSRLSHTFGFLATEIPLCFEINEDESFSGFLSKAKKRIVGSLSKELLSIDWFVGHYPNCFDYLYIYQEEGKNICLNGMEIKPIWLEQVDAPKDDRQSFSMSIEDYFEKKKGNISTEKKPSEPAQEQAEENEDEDSGNSEKLAIIIHPGKKYELELSYLTNCFRRDTIEAMHRYYNEMLQRVHHTLGKAVTVGDILG